MNVCVTVQAEAEERETRDRPVMEHVTLVKSVAHRLAHRMTVAALRALRVEWKIGVVTNGMPDVQARKVTALGLEPLVDCVVYANAYGSGAGKPDREPFLEALRRLDVTPDRAVFVGDDDYCDVFGASRVGMRTVLAATWNMRPRGRPVRADTVVVRLRDVPRIAERLVDARWRDHVA